MSSELWGDGDEEILRKAETEVGAAESEAQVRKVLRTWLSYLSDPPLDPDIEAVRVFLPMFHAWMRDAPEFGARDRFDWPCIVGSAEESADCKEVVGGESPPPDSAVAQI